MAEHQGTTSAPIILVPGFWLGAWAWDEVAETLRADGHDVTALTLPGLESVDADRSASADSRPGRVIAVTSWPSARSAATTSSHAHAPSQKPGTRMIGAEAPCVSAITTSK